MANLQVKNVPEELHERLRRHALRENCTMSAAVLAAIEKELERSEWRERMANRPIVDLGVPAAQLIEEARAERDKELGIE
ncbi:MAG: toxin-antitoxin system HicB family antitoxin [Dehalococcoidia bacterium]|nr:toxin-antitoxin system HicB family antitoxin [Chloroflexota bacterium]MXW25821.1 toxin-antitoxin system HicB family antitoxin [Dehalococcoidia bacterium]MXY87344.1 toxin-antitoxin system HicB family antitoxin [Dehalococcoidia bacterium]MYA53500.1 toxin-antitoxin system HicB family antitoxin [Dehalococcoidia bacterium]